MLYEYRCHECTHQFEVQAKLADPPPSECPQCKKANSLEKVIFATSFALKGSGWYTTDYKKPKADGACQGSGSGSKAEA